MEIHFLFIEMSWKSHGKSLLNKSGHPYISRANGVGFAEYLYTVVAGGIFHDCAVHDIDMVCWIVGNFPSSVYVVAHAHIDVIRSLNDVDTVIISMKFRDGTLATIDLSRFAAYGYDQRVEVWFNVYALCLIKTWQYICDHNSGKTTTTTTLLQPFYDPLSGTTQVSRYQKDKPFWILLKQTWWGSSGISWTICTLFAVSYTHLTLPTNREV